MAEVFNLPAPLFATGVFFLGLLVGSFLNVVILRLPPRMEHEWRCQCRELLELPAEETTAPPGVVWGVSRCPGCGHRIRAWENIPLLSWLMLRGRCSGCGKRISPRYPLVEGLTAATFAATALTFGPSGTTLAALVLTGILIALAGIDIDHQLLPDPLTLTLLWIGLAMSLTGLFTDPVSSVIGAMAGYLSLWTVFHAFRLLTGKEGMGYGDFKLMAALGAWLGWQALPIIILLSSLIGAVVGIGLIALRRRGSAQPMPFGPFIALAGWISLLWGDDLLQAYLALSGLA